MDLFKTIKKGVQSVVEKSYAKRFESAENDLEKEKLKQQLQNVIVLAEKEKAEISKKLELAEEKLNWLKAERDAIEKSLKSVPKVVEVEKVVEETPVEVVEEKEEE